MNYSGQIYPDNTVGYFRIASDTGRHPVEPIVCGEFRIGSAAGCHLRFGDARMPDVAATLHVEPGSVLMRAPGGGDRVCVNGTPETECQLHDGDLLEVAGYRLLFRFVAAQNRITLDEDAFSSESTGPNSPATADQLIDRLSEQIRLVEELAQTPESAIQELVSAAAKAAESTSQSDAGAGMGNSPEVRSVLDLLHHQHETSRIRMESMTRILDSVVEQQKLIADTLAVLSDRVQALDNPAFLPRRASA